jgi:large subunit ribosomal protein L25
MAATTTKLEVAVRTAGGSREARRLRRSGRVPGVIYGGGDDPLSFDVDARELRLALASSGAVIDVSIDGGKATPVVLKEAQRDAVRGQTLHLDLLRVRLDQAIHAIVPLELIGGEESPGAREGGVLEQPTRELNVEALPNNIPEAIQFDVSAMEINDTITLESVAAPEGVTLLDDPETTVATLTPPRMQAELDEIEAETEVVGEGEGEAQAEGATGDEAEGQPDAAAEGGGEPAGE